MVRLIYFGMGGQFSLIPLKRLIESGIGVSAVVTPAEQFATGSGPRRIDPPPPASSTLPLVNPYLQQDIVNLAWTHQIPVWEVVSLSDPETLAFLKRLQPDLISIVCFPHIFPPALLKMPRHGCINMHPSLLPAYRGPSPLFWIARLDERETGVTLHFLDQGIDTGDIVAQTGFARPDGLSRVELEQRCGAEGALLLVNAIQQLEQGGALPRRAQPETGASYYAWPTKTDLIIPTGWPAQRAFNFIRGAEGWSLTVAAADIRLSVREAISYAAEQRLDEPYRLFGHEAWIQFQPGVLRLKIEPIT